MAQAPADPPDVRPARPDEPKVPAEELARFLATLSPALAEATKIAGLPVTFLDLPVAEEWNGPAYAVAALFDPHLLTAAVPPVEVRLAPPSAPLPGLAADKERPSQKEYIRFAAANDRECLYRLPMVWGGVPFTPFTIAADGGWRVMATVGEWPGLLVRPGQAVFSFEPLRVMHRYLCTAMPADTGHWTDLLARAILAAGGVDSRLDSHPLRRDFHSFGINLVLVCQLAHACGRSGIVPAAALGAIIKTAAGLHVAGDADAAETRLAEAFRILAGIRRELVSRPVYFLSLPHGGILFEGEGYAEYDCPDDAARVLNLMLDWNETCGFRFAPDIGAAPLRAFARTSPRTVARLKAAWDEGRIEFVNGTYSQPYMHLLPLWEQEQQFKRGQATLKELFGRAAGTFAAQDMALHPDLPDLLARHGFRYAIHRSQNFGLAPLDRRALVTWRGPAGGAVRALPAHPLRTERRGGETFRHLPVLLASSRNDGLPFIACTSFMDQTFVDIYQEEVIRAHRFAPVWCEFVTPAEFFRKTAGLPAPSARYRLDDYHYTLEASGGIHAPQFGGYASQNAFLFAEGRRLRELEENRALADETLDRFLNQEAHDCYIIPYFATGNFMEGGLTDYAGPRYHYTHDGPRGVERFIRDAAGYPDTYADLPPARPDDSAWNGEVLSAGGFSAAIDPTDGSVQSLGTAKGRWSALAFGNKPFAVSSWRFAGNRLTASGTLAGFGEAELAYFLSGSTLYAVANRAGADRSWNMLRSGWSECARVDHGIADSLVPARRVGNVVEPTAKELFHALGEVRLGPVVLAVGGNVFFRQRPGRVENRLWCYGEFSRAFWWSLTPSAAAR